VRERAKSGDLSVAEPLVGPVQRAGAATTILVVDDDDDTRLLLADVLRQRGYEVRSATDGPEALALLDEFAPQIAILDIGLPGMDGYELAVRMRKVQLPRRVQLIAVSGYGQEADLARSQAAGFDQHLVKPVDSRRLFETIAALSAA